MKRIIFVLISAVIVFVVTLAFTNHYISERAIEIADKHNIRMLNSFSDQFNDELSRTQQAAQSFLAAEFNTCYDSIHHTPIFYLSEANKKAFIDWIHRDMKDFLNFNPYFTEVFFIVDDSISEANEQYGYFKGFAVYNTQDDDCTHLMQHYDFMHSVSYNIVKTRHKPFWTIPSLHSAMRGKIITLFVPVFGDDKTFFGAFGLNIDVTVIKNIMAKHLPYGKDDSEMILYDRKENIIASSPDTFEQYEGEKYLYYKRYIPIADWYIMTACHEDAIYSNANHIRWIVFLTSGAGMLMILLCCIVIFQQIRKTMRKKAAAEEELRLAAQVQTSLLKSSKFQVPGAKFQVAAFMRPAKEAGGDLYDYANVLCTEDKASKAGADANANQSPSSSRACPESVEGLIFCIGDVSGKGMPAALFMTQVMSLFRNAVRHLSEPAEIVTEINDVLAADNPKMTFCTFFVGKFSEGRLTFCNAGHNPPVIISGSPSYLKVRPNLALGLMEGYPYKQESVVFPAGSKLVCYTDGVTEAKNKRHQQYGEERLLEVLSTIGTEDGEDINNKIVTSVEQYVGGAQQSDDITLVTVMG